MAKVVLSAFPMIDPETYREVLDEAVDEPVEIEVAQPGSTERLIEAAAGADAVVTDIDTPVTDEALGRLDLRAVVRAAVGVDNVDVGAAAERGVTVTRAPDYCTDEVAIHSVSLLLACLRSLKAYDDHVVDDGWSWEVGRPIRRVSASTVGFVSFARSPGGARPSRSPDSTLISSPTTRSSRPTRWRKYGRESGFRRAVRPGRSRRRLRPLTDATRGMVDADALARLDESSVVVNVSRGPVVDADALLDALESETIKGAGLDVLAEEPPEDDPLVDRDDTIVTPHAAWYSEAARDDLNRSGAVDVAAVLNGETPDGRVDPDADWL